MKKEALLARIKGGLKGEMDSVNLYAQAKEAAKSQDVIDFFDDRIKEEQLHYNYLLQYYKDIDSGYEAKELKIDLTPTEENQSPIISKEFLKRIGKNQALFSAISTGILLEKNAIDYYKKCSIEEENWVLKKFYETMAEWEGRHYDDLFKIQKEAEEFYWNENNFQPF